MKQHHPQPLGRPCCGGFRQYDHRPQHTTGHRHRTAIADQQLDGSTNLPLRYDSGSEVKLAICLNRLSRVKNPSQRKLRQHNSQCEKHDSCQPEACGHQLSLSQGNDSLGAFRNFLTNRCILRGRSQRSLQPPRPLLNPCQLWTW